MRREIYPSFNNSERHTNGGWIAIQTEVEQYNYSEFALGGDGFLSFRTILPVGSRAPDLTLTELQTGRSVQLREYWQGQDLLVEFGSLT